MSRSKWGWGKFSATGQVSCPSISQVSRSCAGGPQGVPSFSLLSGCFTTVPATRQLTS